MIAIFLRFKILRADPYFFSCLNKIKNKTKTVQVRSIWSWPGTNGQGFRLSTLIIFKDNSISNKKSTHKCNSYIFTKILFV